MKHQPVSTIFTLFLLIASFIHFADATASSTNSMVAFDAEDAVNTILLRLFKEEDYEAIMTNYVTDQRYLRGKKLQESIDFQKKPYYQLQQQPNAGVSRGQVITLAIIVTLTVALAVYSLFLYREFTAITLYNVLGYRLFSDPDEHTSGAQNDVEMS